jgi:hypothetical protein
LTDSADKLKFYNKEYPAKIKHIVPLHPSYIILNKSKSTPIKIANSTNGEEISIKKTYFFKKKHRSA